MFLNSSSSSSNFKNILQKCLYIKFWNMNAERATLFGGWNITKLSDYLDYIYVPLNPAYPRGYWKRK